MRSLPVVVAFALTLLAVLPVLSAAQSIVRVSGCTDVGVVTVNCTFPATLHLTVANFTFSDSAMANLGLGLVVGTSTTFTYGLTLDPTDSSNQTVIGILTSTGYNPAKMGVLLGLSLSNWRVNLATPVFKGVEFSYQPPPSLSSISGCQGSGNGTYNCIPDQTTLTLIGVDFEWLALGSTAVCVGLRCSQIRLTLINDSCVEIALSERYVELLLPQHYGGGVLDFYFDLAPYNGHSYTNSLFISIAQLPLPFVSSITSISSADRGCIPSGSAAVPNFTSCIPFQSVLVVSGSYLSDSNVSVAGLPCLVLSASQQPGGLVVRLPIFSFTPLQPYDLIITNPTGSWVGDGTIAFTAAPAAYAITTGKEFQLTTVELNAGGWNQQNSTIVIYGFNFYADPTLQVVISTYQRAFVTGGEVNVTCGQPTFINSTAVSCVLPVLNATLGPLFWGYNCEVRVLFNSSQVVTPELVLPVYDYPNAPQVSSVAGCPSAVSALQLADCATGAGVVLTLTGSNLGVWNSSSTTIQSRDFPALQCRPLPGSTSSLLLCELDPTYPILANRIYIFTVSVGIMRSAYFRVSFASQTPPVESSSGPSSGLVIVAIVLSVTLPLMAALAAIAWWKRRQCDCKECEERLTSSNRASDEVDMEMSGL